MPVIPGDFCRGSTKKSGVSVITVALRRERGVKQLAGWHGKRVPTLSNVPSLVLPQAVQRLVFWNRHADGRIAGPISTVFPDIFSRFFVFMNEN